MILKNYFRYTIRIIIFDIIANLFFNITLLNASPFLYKLEKVESKFDEHYTLQDEIESAVFLAEDKYGTVVAVKKYNPYTKELVQKELEIAKLIDHPNIVKIREVFFEKSTAYVVLDHIKGETFTCFEGDSLEKRVALMQQFLSAVEHLLLRNIVLKDITPKNFLISPDHAHLTLVNLADCEIMDYNTEISIEHYVEQIENTLINIGGEAAKKIESYKYFLSSTSHDEMISSHHVKVLVLWIEAIQKELYTPLNLNNTISQNSADNVMASHTKLQAKYPHHISFNTAQHSQFLAYSLVAANILKKISPCKYSDAYLQNIHILRYLCDHPPKSLKELFQSYPVRTDYDTAFPPVSSALISVSPSLKEKERQESAWGIFENNDREDHVPYFICKFLESEKIAPVHFKSRIEALVEETPQSNTGLIYTYFIPKDAPLYKAIYLSKDYGIPIGDPLAENTLLDFYEQYYQGQIEGNDIQLRFLPSALTAENHFDLTHIKTYRFTTIPLEELSDFAKKIECVIDEIFKDHLEEMLGLAALAYEVEALSDPIEKQKGYQKLCHKHLCRRDLQLALYYWHKLDDQIPNKFSYLTATIACLLKNNQLNEAKHYFEFYEEKLPHKDQLVVRFALIYIDQDNQPMLDQMIRKLSESKLKECILAVAGGIYPEYAQQNLLEKFEFPMDDDALIDLAE